MNLHLHIFLDSANILSVLINNLNQVSGFVDIHDYNIESELWLFHVTNRVVFSACDYTEIKWVGRDRKYLYFKKKIQMPHWFIPLDIIEKTKLRIKESNRGISKICENFMPKFLLAIIQAEEKCYTDELVKPSY